MTRIPLLSFLTFLCLHYKSNRFNSFNCQYMKSSAPFLKLKLFIVQKFSCKSNLKRFFEPDIDCLNFAQGERRKSSQELMLYPDLTLTPDRRRSGYEITWEHYVRERFQISFKLQISIATKVKTRERSLNSSFLFETRTDSNFWQLLNSVHYFVVKHKTHYKRGLPLKK